MSTQLLAKFLEAMIKHFILIDFSEIFHVFFYLAQC